MSKKKKIVWHKKQGHFIPSVSIKSPAHHTDSAPGASEAKAAEPSLKKKMFVQNLSAMIKKAARDASRGPGDP